MTGALEMQAVGVFKHKPRPKTSSTISTPSSYSVCSLSIK